jgi:hypothetical protein
MRREGARSGTAYGRAPMAAKAGSQIKNPSAEMLSASLEKRHGENAKATDDARNR